MADLVILLAQQTLPRMDSMYWIMLVSRILHILGAIILVGGLFYIRTVVTPAVPQVDAATPEQLFGGRRAAWAMWVGIASLLLLGTGLWNYIQVMKTHERLASSYHMMAGIKMLTGLALFVLAAILAGRSAAAETLRRNWRLWLNVCLLLGILTAVLGSFLRTYPRTPKLDAPGAPELIAPANTAPVG